MNYLLFNLFKCLLLLRSPFEIIHLPGHVIERAYNLAAIWDVHLPKANGWGGTHTTDIILLSKSKSQKMLQVNITI